VITPSARMPPPGATVMLTMAMTGGGAAAAAAAADPAAAVAAARAGYGQPLLARGLSLLYFVGWRWLAKSDSLALWFEQHAARGLLAGGAQMGCKQDSECSVEATTMPESLAPPRDAARSCRHPTFLHAPPRSWCACYIHVQSSSAVPLPASRHGRPVTWLNCRLSDVGAQASRECAAARARAASVVPPAAATCARRLAGADLVANCWPFTCVGVTSAIRESTTTWRTLGPQA
jgi:hypothetical protein